MPMIDVYAAAGTLPDSHALARDLAAAVMRWEQVPEEARVAEATACAGASRRQCCDRGTASCPGGGVHPHAPPARCERILPLADFTPKPKLSSGYESWCCPCRNESLRPWRAKRRAAAGVSSRT